MRFTQHLTERFKPRSDRCSRRVVVGEDLAAPRGEDAWRQGRRSSRSVSTAPPPTLRVRITRGKPISGHTFSLMDTTPLRGAGLVGFVGSSDLSRSRAFYEAVLGLAVVHDNAYACVFDVAGTTLRITAVSEAVVAPYTVLGWQVDDIDTTVDGLRARGVTFTIYPGMDQDDRGIWTAPSGGRIAWFFDPDGHTLSLTQPTG